MTRDDGLTEVVPPAAVRAGQPMAHFGGMLATDLLAVVDLVRHPEVLDEGGWWAVEASFEGRITGYRFGHVRRAPLPVLVRSGSTASSRTGARPGVAAEGWDGPPRQSWSSSLDHDQYVAGVLAIRDRIAAGEIYQVNLTRLLSAPLSPDADPLALAHRLFRHNPAPYQGVLDTGSEWLVTASPELFLSRSGSMVESSPVKGTAPPGEPFLDKDFPENIMITDLVRNDLGRVAAAGSVVVTALAARQEHPGVSHLVSTVQARLRAGVGWKQLLAATFPPGSVTGAPKHTALQVIADLEPVPRGPYCGALGYVDADRNASVLAVGIRTFFTDTDAGGSCRLNFGTGAGITYSSDPEAEWQETALKAARLIALASC